MNELEGSSNESGAKASSLSIPISIVLAGVLIAGAVYMSGTKSESSGQTASAVPPADERGGASANIVVTAPNKADHILGSPNAKVTLIEFSDTECPFCKSYHQTMKRILDTYGKDGSVSWVYRHFPLPQLHKKAKREAEATECAAELGGNKAFWSYIDRIFELTPSNDGLDQALLPQIAGDVGLDVAEFQRCLESGRHGPRVEESYQAALTAGGSGTPYTVAVLSRPLSTSESASLVGEVASAWQSQSGQTLPPDFLIVDVSGDKVAWSGAFPYDLAASVVERLIKL